MFVGTADEDLDDIIGSWFYVKDYRYYGVSLDDRAVFTRKK